MKYISFFNECYRLYFILRVAIHYGLSEFIPKKKLILPLRNVWNILLFWIPNKYPELMLGERLCLAFQELGPVWIKFGQMLSTRKDIFSSSIIDSLSILQNQVKPCNTILIRSYIEHSIGKPLELWLDDFKDNPIAAASISQVYTARLKRNGKEVVIKVVRPDIFSIIKVDICLMYRLAIVISKLFTDLNRLKCIEIISEYEKILLNELNLLAEMANTIRLRRNFQESNMLYIPEVYPDFCSKNVLVMERIYGIPINNVETLRDQGFNMQLLAERGIKIFFTQVFRDSFFHGDMHPGNVFVSYCNPDNPQYISIDCGIVGSLNKRDKHYLAANLLAFFNRDYRKVAELHIDSGWIPVATDIEKFESAIRTVFEPIFEKSLEDISFGHILLNLFDTAKMFHMEVQPQLVLLQKSLLYIEGMVRQLYPKLDLWKIVKPFLEKWINEQTSILVLFRSFKERIPSLIDKIPEIPELLYDVFRENKLLQKTLDDISVELRMQRIKKDQFRFLHIISVILLFSGYYVITYCLNQHLLSFFFILLGMIILLIIWYKLI